MSTAESDKAMHVQRLFLSHSASIRRFVYSLLPSTADVDDVFQDVFLTATARADSYTPDTDFRAWIYVIVKFKVLEHKRRNERVQLLSSAAIDALISDQPDLDHKEDEIDRLRHCMRRLSPSAKQMIEMRYREGLSAQEIGCRRKVGVNSVYVLLTRARQFLRDCINRHHEREHGTAGA